MEDPKILELAIWEGRGQSDTKVKLLQFGAPPESVDLWTAPPAPTTQSIVRSLRLLKVAQGDAQCQANIQIDPLSDLVKQHVRSAVLTPMSFSEVVDVTEDDYRPKPAVESTEKGDRKLGDRNRFLTKAEFEDYRKDREDPMEHYRETWEFQQKWMKERVARCQKATAALQYGMEDITADFKALGISRNVVQAEDVQRNTEQEEAERTRVAEELLARNKELCGEVDALLSRAREQPLPEATVPVRTEQGYNTSLALTKRLTTAFEKAANAVSISAKSKTLAQQKRKLYNSRKK